MESISSMVERSHYIKLSNSVSKNPDNILRIINFLENNTSGNERLCKELTDSMSSNIRTEILIRYNHVSSLNMVYYFEIMCDDDTLILFKILFSDYLYV